MSSRKRYSDESLDAQLRDVAVPDSLTEWIKGEGWRPAPPLAGQSGGQLASARDGSETFADGEEMVRPEFLASLAAAVQAEYLSESGGVSQPVEEAPQLPANPARWSDAQLDAALRYVPLPEYFAQRMRDLHVRRPQMKLRENAWAASLTVLVCVSYAAAMALVFFAVGPASTIQPVEALAANEIADSLVMSDPVVIEPESEPSWLSTATAGAFAVPEIAAPQLAEELNDQVASAELFRAPWQTLLLPGEQSVDFGRALDPSFAFSRTGELPRHLEPLPGWMQRTFVRPFLGKAADVGDNQPVLHRLPGHVSSGVAPPDLEGFDWNFFLRHDEHPLIRLQSAATDLATSKVPVDIDRASFDLGWRYLEDGELPPARTVRKEEYIAAFDYGYPKVPAGDVKVFAYGGTSPYRGDFDLLQVGLRVGPESPEALRAARAQPQNVVIVVDISNSMRRNGRLRSVRRALLHYLAQLGPEQRWSLIASGETAQVLVENAGPDDEESLAAALHSLEAGGGTLLSAGLEAGLTLANAQAKVAAEAQQAAAEAGKETKLPATKLVVIGDQPEFFDFATRHRIELGCERAKVLGVACSLIDLTLPTPPEIKSQGSTLLAQLAQLAGGKHLTANAALDIDAALGEALTGKSPVIGKDALCTVKFNPAVVQSYRLIGHEQSSLLAPVAAVPATKASQLRAGQVSTVMYELKFEEDKKKKSRPQEVVAEVELSWLNEAGQVQRRTTKLERGKFAAKVSESAPPLQFAAVVALAAEVLRHSPYADEGDDADTMRDVREYAQRVEPALGYQPAFRDLIDFLDAAMDPRSHRRQRRN